MAMAVVAACALVIAETGSADAPALKAREPRAITDGRLRPGHLEVIRVTGFPGRGVTEVSFFPTAICEDSCGARSFQGGETDETGVAKLRVRVPGVFFDHRERPTYFRDGERIEVHVTWEGPGDAFAAAFVEPEPILVRTHRSRRG